MGARGPKPMTDEELAARGGRRRLRVADASDATRLAMAQEIAVLERDGRRIYKQAIRRPVIDTPGNGEQVSGKLKAALALLDRAMKLRLALDRLGGPVGGERRHDDDVNQAARYAAARRRF